MSQEPEYTIDALEVISEIFDGEAVVIHMKTGAYYSFPPEATALWEQLTAGVAIGDLTNQENRSEILAWLAAEELIDLTDSALTTRSPDESETGPLGITKFTDMADMLLADPIHDIDYEAEGFTVRNDSDPGPKDS